MRLRPDWIDKELYEIASLNEITSNIYDKINGKLEQLKSDKPKVSIVIPAWNEELNIVKTIDSLSSSVFDKGLEIIIVDNNSKDKTPEVLQKLNVVSLSQPIQGVGPARQLGQLNAQGEYILTADSDCFYPPTWVEVMLKNLEKKNVSCVYGTYSFITSNYQEKIYYFFYEGLRNLSHRLRHLKRPFLNCLGMSMGYLKSNGVEVGFIEKNIRGEDGRMAYELMKYGKIRYVGSNSAKVWTGLRTISIEGGLMSHLWKNIKKELGSFGKYFTKIKDHDPKETVSKENYSSKD